VDEKTISDAPWHGMGSSGDASLPNYAGQLVAHRVDVVRPHASGCGSRIGLSAPDVMYLIEKVDKGVRNRDRPCDIVPALRRAVQDNRSAGDVDLLSCFYCILLK
jgi:hypothetical protein